MIDNEDSNSDDESDPKFYNPYTLNRFFDETELSRMQLDDETAKREYLKITVTNVLNKQDTKYIYMDFEMIRAVDINLLYEFLVKQILMN